jgi:hypothetical protein
MEEFGCMKIDLMQQAALVIGGSRVATETIVPAFLLT